MDNFLAHWLPQHPFYWGEPSKPPHVAIAYREPFMSGHHLVAKCNSDTYQLFLDDNGQNLIDDAGRWLEESYTRPSPTTPGAQLHGDIPGPSDVLRAPRPDESLLNYVIRERDTGEKFMVRIFQHLHPGKSSEAELLAQLSGPHFPSLVGYVTLEVDGVTYTLSAIETFMEGDNGREIAEQNSAAGLYIHDQVYNLGETVRFMHDALAMAFPTDHAPGATLAEAVRANFTRAAENDPQVAGLRDRVELLLSRLPDSLPVQRVHGKLGLNQTLMNGNQWSIVHFTESAPRGEPVLRVPAEDVAQLVTSIRTVAAHAPEWCEAVVRILLEGYGISETDPVLQARLAYNGFELLATSASPEIRAQALRIISPTL